MGRAPLVCIFHLTYSGYSFTTLIFFSLEQPFEFFYLFSFFKMYVKIINILNQLSKKLKKEREKTKRPQASI